jgi:Flp pilus assembly protein TadG
VVARLRSRTRRRPDRGAVAVEFALIMPIFLLLIFGVIQYGWYFYAMQTGTSAVGDAVRRVTVGACQSDGDLKTFVENRLGSARVGSSAVIVDRDYEKLDTATGNYVPDSTPGPVGGKVTIEIQFSTMNLHFPLIPVPDNGTVTRIFTGRMEDTTAAGSPCS